MLKWLKEEEVESLLKGLEKLKFQPVSFDSQQPRGESLSLTGAMNRLLEDNDQKWGLQIKGGLKRSDR